MSAEREAAQLAIVLHAHLPFVRHPEHPRHLEERWLFEAITECYLPIIGALDRLAHDGVPVAITMSITPTLGDMLRDDLLCARFEQHLARTESLIRKEQRRVRAEPRMHAVVAFYGARLEEARETWERHRGDLIGALVGHARAGRLDLLASAATHAFLPGLLAVPEAIAGQVHVGMLAFEAQTGLAAVGFWLPECAYHPAFDAILGDAGVGYCVVEEAAFRLARPRPMAGVYAPIASPSGVAFFGRDQTSSRQVWSRDEGYPGDPTYREYYRDIGYDLPQNELLGEEGPFGVRIPTGLKYHRVTSEHAALADKEVYDAVHAKERAREHAEHFVAKRIEQGRALAESVTGDAPPIMVAPYDAELFGHWWFEGPWFLEALFRVAARPDVRAQLRPVTLRDRLRENPAMVRATPAASTWGANANSSVWVDPSNASLWRHVHHASRRAIESARRARSDDSEDVAEARRQIAIEAMLLQSSDWPFILRTKTSEGYALARARAHATRVRRLSEALSKGQPDHALIEDIAGRDDFLRTLPRAWLATLATARR